MTIPRRVSRADSDRRDPAAALHPSPRWCPTCGCCGRTRGPWEGRSRVPVFHPASRSLVSIASAMMATPPPSAKTTLPTAPMANTLRSEGSGPLTARSNRVAHPGGGAGQVEIPAPPPAVGSSTGRIRLVVGTRIDSAVLHPGANSGGGSKLGSSRFPSVGSRATASEVHAIRQHSRPTTPRTSGGLGSSAPPRTGPGPPGWSPVGGQHCGVQRLLPDVGYRG